MNARRVGKNATEPKANARQKRNKNKKRHRCADNQREITDGPEHEEPKTREDATETEKRAITETKKASD